MSYLLFRIMGFVIGLIFIACSAFYAAMMPIFELPVPSGALHVGTTALSLIDELRTEIHTEDPNDRRALFLEIWYPAIMEEPFDLSVTNPLWQELYKGDLDVVSFFMDYLKAVKTHSVPGAPVDRLNGPYPVILFNHGLQMFTSQNTLLVEHLVSQGYIVVSVAHPYESLRVNLEKTGTVLPPFLQSMDNFKEGMSWIASSSQPILAAKEAIQNMDEPSERVRTMLDAIKYSEMNDMVAYWETDNQFVLDQLLSGTVWGEDLMAVMDTSKIGVMGMSIGGATATEFAKSDQRVKAAINIDGLQYGHKNGSPLNKPFMMIYSQDGAGLNEFLRSDCTDDYYEYTFKDARHADFTDMPVIWPVMRTYGQLGTIPADRMMALTNQIILNFWDRYLKGRPIQELDIEEVPEVEVYSKAF